MLEAGKDKDYVSNWYPGWMYKVDNYLKNDDYGPNTILKREPVTLDFDVLTKTMMSKSAGPARMVAARALSAVNLDAGLNAEAWTNATPYPLTGLNGTTTTANTKVRALFDDKNLYLGFECDEPEVDNMKLMEGKRDGDIWSDDCVEMFIDPWATRSKYFHLMAVPKNGCYYDAQAGFINDPLNPMMGKEDTSWNPDWKYSFRVDKNGKKWTLVASIPFTVLGVEPPKTGTEWAVNFGRERQAGKSAELSIWSPNEFGTGFCEPAAFGRLYFEKEPQK